MIPVTKTFLPPIKEYERYLKQIWESGWVTNNGKFSQQLEKKLENYLGINHLHYVTSGTIALQLAIRALELEGEIITTPFSYVATTSSILWERFTPVYVDIDPDTLCMDAKKIEEAITPVTTAILATHVYGIPCDMEMIRDVADRHDLKVIYDGAHAFGVRYKGRSVMSHGDLTAISFHATKLFHTVEGGAVISTNKDLAEKIFLSKTFGHKNNEHIQLGINGKNSEMHAAMGLCLLPRIDEIIQKRKQVSEWYKSRLDNEKLRYPVIHPSVDYNYAYFPVLFDSQELMLEVKKELEDHQIFTRRYFYPSLNKLGYLTKSDRCPVSEDAAEKVLCLPLYDSLEEEQVDRISSLINKKLEKA